MNPRSRSKLTLALATVLTLGVAVACHDSTSDSEPVAPQSARKVAAAQQARPRTIDEMFDVVALRLPGFAGLYLNGDGELVVRMTGRHAPTNLLPTIREVLGVVPGKPGTLHVEDAKYDFHRLRGFEKAILSTIRLPDYTWISVNETTNQIVLRLPDELTAVAMKSAVVALGVPLDALDVGIEAPIRFVSTLQDSTNPLIGGIVAGIRNGISSTHDCTAGFNVKLPADTTKLYEVTAEHCTTTIGQLDVADTLFQPSWLSGPPENHKIGMAYAEAPFVTVSDTACPVDRTCKWADATLFKYDAAARGTLGVLARTVHYNDATHPKNINRDTHDFAITGELPVGYFVANQWMAKVGKTTGWSAGKIDSAYVCGHLTIPGNRAYMCLYAVYDFMNAGASNFVDGGDSGGPVFLPVYSEDDIYGGVNWLAGITQSASSRADGKALFFFSPLSGIKLDLGSMITAPGGGCTPNVFLNGCQ
jgi:hypothetical protein